MTQAAKTQERSMEEILASIRRIITDDDASEPAKAPEAAPAEKQQPVVTAAPSRPTPLPASAKTTLPPAAPKPAPTPANAAARPAPGFRTIDGAFDLAFTTKPESPLIDRGLISNETIAAVDSAFNTLANTIIGQKPRTLEDLVKEMLRPMLKSWLDDNLPSLVERIVRGEIERVSRGRP
jgi:cell pole-organizing protein PopZ